MKDILIDGRCAIFEYAGDVKHIARTSPHVAAAWLSGDKTFVVIKLSLGSNKSWVLSYMKSLFKVSPLAFQINKYGAKIIQLEYEMN